MLVQSRPLSCRRWNCASMPACVTARAGSVRSTTYAESPAHKAPAYCVTQPGAALPRPWRRSATSPRMRATSSFEVKKFPIESLSGPGPLAPVSNTSPKTRSEERRVGKECRVQGPACGSSYGVDGMGTRAVGDAECDGIRFERHGRVDGD